MNITQIREDFPILKREFEGNKLVFLDSAATSQKPQQVIQSLVDYYEKHNANIHRGVYRLSEEATGMVDEARAKVARFIGAEEKEVIFVRNASEAINLLMYTFGEININEGDAVVVSLLEHHSNIVPWQILAAKKKAQLRVVGIDDNGELIERGSEIKKVGGDESVVTGSLEELLDETVKLVALTAVSNALGTKVDIKHVVSIIKKKAPQAKILVDGSQLVPHQKVNVKELGIDFLAFSGHKMLGPTGIGVLWGRKEILEGMPPFLFGGDMISEVTLEKTSWNELPWKFEAGTPHIEGIIGLGAAVDYLSSVGMEEIENYEKELTEYGLRKLEDLEKKGVVTIYGPREAAKRAGVLTFNVNGVHPHDVAQVLDSFGIAVRSGQHCAAPVVTSYGVMAMVRASMYLYNTKEELDYLFDKIPEVIKVFNY